jgi:hypothetical protein
MKLLTAELRACLPKLYTQDGNPNPTVHARFFFPLGTWTWLVTEGQPVDSEGDFLHTEPGNMRPHPDEADFLFFGYVLGHFPEWGHFRLSDLQTRLTHNLTVERDISFTPQPFNQVLSREVY